MKHIIMAVLLFLAGFSQRVNAQCGSSVPIVYYADNTSNRYSNGGGGNLMPFVTVSDIAGGTFVDVASGSSLEGVAGQLQATVYRMDGAPASGGAYDTSKYYSITITTAANAPIMKFNSFGAQALTTSLTSGQTNLPRLHYWLGGAIVDQSTGIETSVFNTNITNGHNSDNNPRYAAVDYNLQPGRTYTLKLYAAGGYQGRVYMDNPRLQFAPIPKVNNASLCLSDLSGTVGTALASRVTSTTPSDTQLRWFSGGTEVTGQPIATGTYTARYYTTAGACNGADSETITVGTTCTPACLPFGSTFSFTNTGNTSTAGYTTKYVLVNNSGNIIQEVTSGFTVPSTAGNYSVYAVNYADADSPNLAAGTPIADVIADTGCVSASAPLNFEVCSLPPGCSGPDSDGDVIPDMCDLDADNDGILNTNECYGEKITNGSFTGNANGWTLGGSWAYNNNSVNNFADNITNEKLSQTLAPLSTQTYKLSFNIGVRDYSSNSSYTGSLTIRLGGVIYAVINNGTGNSNNITMTLHNGATSTFVPFSSPTAPLLINYKDITIDIPYVYSTSQDNEVSFSMTADGDDFFIDDVSLIGGCDTDGDGIPDYLDLDSDNDGCVDAIEGTGGFTLANVSPAGGTVSVGTGSSAANQNLGNTVDTDGVPTIAAGGQGKGSSADATVNACIVGSDIVVNKVGPISAQAGSTISYNVHVTNNGPENATDVVVKDPAVAYFTVTGVTCLAGSGTGGTAVCPSSVTIAGLQGAAGLTIPSLPAGSGITFTVTGTVDGTTGEVITNIATVEYAGDINPSNNNSIVQTNIFKCLTEESTYTVDAEATKALASNVIAPNGGVINLVYKLTSGPAVPGIGNEFTQTVTYSDLNNNFGIDNQWEGLDVATFGTSKLFVLSPKTSAGTGRLYNSLPVNNSTNETLMASNNRGDNIFTSKIADGNLDELGRFTITIGNFPAAPAGYVSTAGSFRVYANGNTSYLPDAATATANSSGFWLKPLIQTGIRNDGSEGVPPIYMMAGNTYEWRYSAFSNGTNFATNYFGTATTARGVLFYHTNSITFAKAPMDCACYKPGLLDPTKELPTKVGITSLSRAGSDNPDNWPMVRKGGHIALESQTKGFVPNRVAFSGGNPVGIPTADYVEGMMVYDTTNKCMKIYTLKDGDASMAWHCVTNQTCPDVSTSFTLNCSQATVSGDTHLDPNVNFTITIPYLNGDGTSYAEQIIPSTVTPGLTAVLAAGTLANGSGNLVLTVSGPSSSSSQGGAYYFEVSINGKVCNILVSITAEPPIT